VGHDVVRVVTVPELGEGGTNEEIAAYAARTDRLVLTADDDFLSGFENIEQVDVLSQSDESLSADEVVSVVETIDQFLGHERAKGDPPVCVSENWLS
jgi:predicted nuclease of predicted toxin-antitoxin system